MAIFHEMRRYPEDFRVWTETYQDMSFHAHWHEEPELIWVREGSASIYIGDDTYDAQAGDLLLCPGGTVHSCPSQDAPNRLSFLLFHSLALPLFPGFFHCPALHLTADALRQAGLAESVSVLFAETAAELTARPPHYQILVQSRLAAFCCLLSRAMPVPESPGFTHPRQSSAMQNLQKSLRHINAHFTEPLSLDAVAAVAGFSPCHFSRLFRRCTGIGFVAYLNTLRAEQAMQILCTESPPISEVALRCGFSSIRSFNRVFRQIVGCSPTAFVQDPAQAAPVPAHPAVEGDSYVIRLSGAGRP